MKPKKKNKLFTLLFSLVPGAAEMYMGFMKMGLSIMAIAGFSILVPALINANDVFLLLTAILWFFGFFHARNIASCDEEDFERLEDMFVWEEFTDGKPIKLPTSAVSKWIAVILIILGCSMLWSNLTDLIMSLGLIPYYEWDRVYSLLDSVPQLAIAILIIFLGIYMIKGKKKQMEQEEENHGCNENN